MRVAIFDRVEPSVPDSFPFRLFATCSQRNAAFKLAFAVPAMALLAAATVMLIVKGYRAPGARNLIALHPALAFEVIAALGFWAYLLGMPVKRLLERLTVTRIVNLDRDCVAVTEHSRLATRTWAIPLSSYLGVAHHVRATLSGSRHEIILVHPERGKSVLLSLAPSIDQSELERVAALLGMAIVPASALYRFSLRWPAIPSWRAPAHA